MTYIDKCEDIDIKECMQCDFNGEVSVITEHEGRYVTITWVCPNCDYVEVSTDYDDDEELGILDPDGDRFREDWVD